MSTAASPKSISQIVDGFPIPSFFLAETFRSAVQYKPHDDDLFLVTYPKCGTNWATQVLLLILKQGEPLASHDMIQGLAPYLELTGAKAAENMARPGIIRTHLPFHLTPWNEKAKYICVTRNPKDTCVSYFHHMKNLPAHGFEGNFDQFFEMFISGTIDYGDYFDHLLGWYEHRNDPNILFLTYEEMKADIEAAVLKMASFMDDKLYAEPLRQDPKKMSNVVKFSSFDYMKDFVGNDLKKMLTMSKEDILKSELPEHVKKMFATMDISTKMKPTDDAPEGNPFIRKGIVGDWRSHFSEDHSRRMDEKFEEKFKNTDIYNFWKGQI